MRFIDIDISDIVQLLQDKMRGIVENMHAWMIAGSCQETLKGHAVVQVLAGMNLEGQIDAVLLGHIEDGPPAFRQFLKAQLDQSSRALRPGIHCGPE